jgi:polyisoprenyl-phosphate glycosyltransferase
MTSGEKLPSISVVVPVFNEEQCLPEFIRRFECFRRQAIDKIIVQAIFVNDGSTDGSFEIIRQIAAHSSYVKAINLSRNFGHQIAVTAGIDASMGDYVAIIDADLQDPPELIQDMYNLACQGFDVVYGKRALRAGETWFKKISAKLFYRLLNRMSDTEIPVDTGDFRLISRRVADTLIEMREVNRFLRGMVPWIGFSSTPLLYTRDKRYSGKTKYPIKKMFRLASNALISFSSKPLQVVINLGTAFLVLGLISSLVLLYLKLFTTIVVPGITSILITIVLFNGLQIILIGLVGSYVARLFDEVKKRPLYVVSESINL